MAFVSATASGAGRGEEENEEAEEEEEGVAPLLKSRPSAGRKRYYIVLDSPFR